MSAYGTKRTNLMGRGTSATEKVCGVAKPNPFSNKRARLGAD